MNPQEAASLRLQLGGRCVDHLAVQTWLRELLLPALERDIFPLKTLAPDLRASVDALGTTAAELMAYQSAAGVNGNINNSAQVNVVPTGKVWKVLWAHVLHNDLTSRRLSIVVHNGTQGQNIHGVTLASTNERVWLPRPIYLPAGWKLYAEVDAIAAGNRVELYSVVMEIPKGSYSLA